MEMQHITHPKHHSKLPAATMFTQAIVFISSLYCWSGWRNIITIQSIFPKRIREYRVLFKLPVHDIFETVVYLVRFHATIRRLKHILKWTSTDRWMELHSMYHVLWKKKTKTDSQPQLGLVCTKPLPHNNRTTSPHPTLINTICPICPRVKSWFSELIKSFYLIDMHSCNEARSFSVLVPR